MIRFANACAAVFNPRLSIKYFLLICVIILCQQYVFSEDSLNGAEALLKDAQWTTLPRELYVGDRAEMRCLVEYKDYDFAPAIGTFSGADGAPLYDSDDVTVYSMTSSINNKYYSLSIAFQVWSAGPVEFPALNGNLIFPDAEIPVTVRLPRVLVGSIIADGGYSDIVSLRAPIVLPGTTYMLCGIIGLCAAIIALIIALGAFLRRTAAVRYLRRSLKRSRRCAQKKLRVLRRRCGESRAADIYSELTALLRVFFEEVFKKPYVSASTSEIQKTFLDFPSYEQADEIVDFFIEADAVKFGGKTVPFEQVSAHIEAASAWIQTAISAALSLAQKAIAPESAELEGGSAHG